VQAHHIVRFLQYALVLVSPWGTGRRAARSGRPLGISRRTWSRQYCWYAFAMLSQMLNSCSHETTACASLEKGAFSGN
jgi:hypothetical protein